MSARLVILLLLCNVTSPARAAREPVFAVVVGVNRPINSQTQRLRYADDDAILFHRLMDTVGRSTLLVEADATSRRVHGDLGQALLPTRANLRRVLEATFAAMERARDLGQRPQFYFVYSGHGDVKNNKGYLALSDGTLDSDDLAREVLAASTAINNHVIIDACRSYYLVHEKRAGGERRPVKAFHHPLNLTQRVPHTGFLLSTSSAESSHEWAGFQAGVFSHEVRSGLLGAADANRDGRVTYDEIWSFIEVANSRIANERFRPHVFMRPPRNDGSRHLLDMQGFRGATLDVPATQSGRYLLEDRYGVRLADLHSAPGQEVTLWLPRAPRPFDRLYLHDLNRLVEYPITLQSGEERLVLASLGGQPSSYREKGAAHEAFTRIFEAPFGLEAFRVQLRCEKARMDAAPCPGYYCQYCRCERCRHLWDEPGVEPLRRTPVVPRRAVVKPRPRQRPPWAYLFSLLADIRLVSRHFDFQDPIYPAQNDEHVSYRSGATPALGLRADLYPLAPFDVGPLAGLGLELSYWRALGLESQPPTGGDPQETTLDELLVGLRYRWNILERPLGPELRFGLDYGRMAFTIHDDPTTYVPLPDVGYELLRLQLLDLTQPLVQKERFRLVARFDFDYRLVFSAGEIESQDSRGYGTSSTGGLGVAGGLTGSWGSFVFGLEGFYARYFLDFDNDCYHSGLGCKAAAGALDVSYGLDILLGFRH